MKIALGQINPTVGDFAGNGYLEPLTLMSYLAGETARNRGPKACRGPYADDDRNLLVAHLAFLHQCP